MSRIYGTVRARRVITPLLCLAPIFFFSRWGFTFVFLYPLVYNSYLFKECFVPFVVKKLANTKLNVMLQQPGKRAYVCVVPILPLVGTYCISIIGTTLPRLVWGGDLVYGLIGIFGLAKSWSPLLAKWPSFDESS